VYGRNWLNLHFVNVLNIKIFSRIYIAFNIFYWNKYLGIISRISFLINFWETVTVWFNIIIRMSELSSHWSNEPHSCITCVFDRPLVRCVPFIHALAHVCYECVYVCIMHVVCVFLVPRVWTMYLVYTWL